MAGYSHADALYEWRDSLRDGDNSGVGELPGNERGHDNDDDDDDDEYDDDDDDDDTTHHCSAVPASPTASSTIGVRCACCTTLSSSVASLANTSALLVMGIVHHCTRR
jgi:hypothetical protein